MHTPEFQSMACQRLYADVIIRWQSDTSRSSVTRCTCLEPRSNRSQHKANRALVHSPEKWLHNRIYCSSNRSKQIQEIHTAYSAGTQYTRQSLNEKQHPWLHRPTVTVCEAMYIVFHSNFAAFIVCRRYKPCGFLGFVWTDCWGNKSYYVITSPAKSNSNVNQLLLYDVITLPVNFKQWFVTKKAWISWPGNGHNLTYTLSKDFSNVNGQRRSNLTRFYAWYNLTGSSREISSWSNYRI